MGTLKDFEELKNKVEKLMGFDIDDWIKELIIIIDKIIETKKGKIDIDFWKNMIINKETMETRGSGELTKVNNIDGWLLNFYPYYKSIDFFNFSEKLVRRKDFNKPIDVEDKPKDCGLKLSEVYPPNLLPFSVSTIANI